MFDIDRSAIGGEAANDSAGVVMPVEIIVRRLR
jgi:hypothetical protein